MRCKYCKHYIPTAGDTYGKCKFKPRRITGNKLKCKEFERREDTNG